LSDDTGTKQRPSARIELNPYMSDACRIEAMSSTVIYRHLESRPTSTYRQLFVKGTRIRAELIYRAHINADEPMSPEEVAVDFGLPLEAVEEAIEYCRSNPPEIAADLAHEEALMAARGQVDPGYKYDARPRVLAPQELAQLDRS
jgi:uncharacterized protein (DUF433 family)